MRIPGKKQKIPLPRVREYIRYSKTFSKKGSKKVCGFDTAGCSGFKKKQKKMRKPVDFCEKWMYSKDIMKIYANKSFNSCWWRWW